MTASSFPKWYRVLQHWRKYGNGGNGAEGLTFSFLVGADREPVGSTFTSSKEAREASEALYNSIVTTKPEGHMPYFEECMRVGDYVVKLGGDIGKEPPSFEQLWGRFSKAIVDGEYSLTKHKHHQMTSDEKKMVNEALSSD